MWKCDRHVLCYIGLLTGLILASVIVAFCSTTFGPNLSDWLRSSGGRTVDKREWKAFQAFLHSDSSAFWLRHVAKAQEVPKEGQDKPIIYIITPTYPRPTQLPELTRMGQSLKSVDNILWIIAEDALEPTQQVIELLQDLDLNYEYLLTPMPQQYRTPDLVKSGKLPKGVANRNAGLEFILERVKQTGDDSGVIYFGDDDNTYDIRLFEEIRNTKKVSMFPVGFLSRRFVSTPILNQQGHFLSFYDGWLGDRDFAVDMAGFAVSVRLFVKRNQVEQVRMVYRHGYEEDSFLKALALAHWEVEFLAQNCTKVYVWHTRTQNPNINEIDIDEDQHTQTNLGVLNKYWCLYVGQHRCGTRWKSRKKRSNSNKAPRKIGKKKISKNKHK